MLYCFATRITSGIPFGTSSGVFCTRDMGLVTLPPARACSLLLYNTCVPLCAGFRGRRRKHPMRLHPLSGCWSHGTVDEVCRFRGDGKSARSTILGEGARSSGRGSHQGEARKSYVAVRQAEQLRGWVLPRGATHLIMAEVRPRCRRHRRLSSPIPL